MHFALVLCPTFLMLWNFFPLMHCLYIKKCQSVWNMKDCSTPSWSLRVGERDVIQASSNWAAASLRGLDWRTIVGTKRRLTLDTWQQSIHDILPVCFCLASPNICFHPESTHVRIWQDIKGTRPIISQVTRRTADSAKHIWSNGMWPLHSITEIYWIKQTNQRDYMVRI